MAKDFDCVEMKRKGAEHVRRLTAGMTREQLLAFWAEETRKLREEQAAARARSARPSPDRKTA